jgi:hypothetical protein
MKTTAQRLGESYCKPQTKEEWKQLSGVFPLGKRFCHQKDAKSYRVEDFTGVVSDIVPHDRTLIPVPHFIDLLHDRIAPWRLEEDGFEKRGAWYIFDTIVGEFCIDRDRYVYSMETEEQANVTTYTQLLTLIELIG